MEFDASAALLRSQSRAIAEDEEDLSEQGYLDYQSDEVGQEEDEDQEDRESIDQ